MNNFLYAFQTEHAIYVKVCIVRVYNFIHTGIIKIWRIISVSIHSINIYRLEIIRPEFQLRTIIINALLIEKIIETQSKS